MTEKFKVKLGFGLTAVGVLGASILYGCSGTQATAGTPGADTATLVAALSVNSDGSSADWADAAATEPVYVEGCGFDHIVDKVVERFDADHSGELDDNEQSDLVSEYGDDATLSADVPHAGDKHGADKASGGREDHAGRAAFLLGLYDADGSGTLEAGELSTLKADIEARCQARLAKLVAEFDANGDGTLDASEWQTAHNALHQRFQDHRAELDQNGDGDVDHDEQATARDQGENTRDGVKAKFDANADGVLSADERAAFEAHVRECVRKDRPMSEASDSSEGDVSEGTGSDDEATESSESGDGASDVAGDTDSEDTGAESDR